MDDIFNRFYERLNSADYTPADFENFLREFNIERENELSSVRAMLDNSAEEIKTLKNEIEVLKGLNPSLETEETGEETEEILTYENLFN